MHGIVPQRLHKIAGRALAAPFRPGFRPSGSRVDRRQKDQRGRTIPEWVKLSATGALRTFFL